MPLIQGGGNGFGMGGGGGGKKICAAKPRKIFYITLAYKKDTILFIIISVVSKIHWAISLFFPYLYVAISRLLIFLVGHVI